MTDEEIEKFEGKDCRVWIGEERFYGRIQRNTNKNRWRLYTDPEDPEDYLNFRSEHFTKITTGCPFLYDSVTVEEYE